MGYCERRLSHLLLLLHPGSFKAPVILFPSPRGSAGPDSMARFKSAGWPGRPQPRPRRRPSTQPWSVLQSFFPFSSWDEPPHWEGNPPSPTSFHFQLRQSFVERALSLSLLFFFFFFYVDNYLIFCDLPFWAAWQFPWR